ncbi:hypothetical protein PLESTF_001753100 [Pleodorina starrii]|nr:hypothetical protein PLESTM_001721900 [Pleodorina starrii]GLC76229.1 hypothetical protein PLESTF_001753100 [Pleodorina starrii]
MQCLGRAVVKYWALLPSQIALATPEILRSGRSSYWALSAVITTSSTAACGAFSTSAANSTSSQTSDASTSSQDESACAALYFTGTAPATDILGPFSLQSIPGKGRGLVAQRELRPGELVMAVQPIAVLHGPQDSMPSPDSLLDWLEATWQSMPPHHRAALRQMFVGRPTASTASDSQRPTDQPTASSPPASSAAVGGSSGGDSTSGLDFRAVVSYNAYGDEYEDLPAADLRGGPPPQSHVGLWPYFSNINHACAPNCVHYVVGSTMVVRAVQVVHEGSELLISYLGRDDLAPRQVRQAVLQSRYGFRCGCARCRTEEDLPEELQSLLQQLYDRSRHELAPRFERLASAASAAAEGLDGGAGALYGENDEDDEDDEAAAAVDGSITGGGGAAAAAATEVAVKVTTPGLTAAELAKRALRKASSSSSSPPPTLGSQLASLEPRLEECARQLHLAVQELQEEDEATEDDDPRVGAASTATTASATSAATAPSSGRQPLTRVQVAQAAAYQLLELLHLHAELTAAAAAASGGGGGAIGGRARAAAAGALQACWHVLDAISRGSELQVFQACKLLNDALQDSGYSGGSGSGGGGKGGGKGGAAPPPPPPEAVREAASLLGQSLLARYGPLRGPQLSRMTQAAIRTSRGFF